MGVVVRCRGPVHLRRRVMLAAPAVALAQRFTGVLSPCLACSGHLVVGLTSSGRRITPTRVPHPRTPTHAHACKLRARPRLMRHVSEIAHSKTKPRIRNILALLLSAELIGRGRGARSLIITAFPAILSTLLVAAFPGKYALRAEVRPRKRGNGVSNALNN